MKSTTMTREDKKIDTPARDGLDGPPWSQSTSAYAYDDPYNDVGGRRITRQGRRLRKWFILANLVGWLVLILAVRAIFF
jgi:hypothetical protein